MINTVPILSILIWTPIVGGLILLLLKQSSDKYIKILGHSISLFVLLISIIVLNEFDAGRYYLQFTERVLWINNFNIYYHLAIDGFSLLFILLTTVTTSLILLFSFSENRDQNNKFISLFFDTRGVT